MLYTGHDRTHGGGGEVAKRIMVGVNQLEQAIDMSCCERVVLVQRVEISCVRDWRSSDITTRARSIAVPFLNDLQNGGGRERCVVCFDDPGFILLHANCGIITHLAPDFIPMVYGETTVSRHFCVESKEDCPNSSPFITHTKIWWYGVDVDAPTIVRHTSCSAWVRREECERGQQKHTDDGDC